ncbi:Uncharacterised protein [Pandoraea pulmonicola]|jgi:hypothetical protein|uniref:Uncharacterized protein n=1 Tax=Pandoraea pulmonicola TaxID=93221 RepID=A0AAJ4ZA61_PANPU|nr:Uncharacterised protein [Pandoraea pulmonicola]
MAHLIDFIDSLLYSDTCVETGMQCAVTVAHVFGY